MNPLAVYIHWPFCQSKCPYCDFNSHVAAGIDHTAWRAAYAKEIAHYAGLLPGRRVTSVFFGGGTPSLMEPQTAAMVLDEIARHWAMDEDCEITLEANPTSSEAGKFASFRQAGINRLSLGVQSLRDEALKFLGRAHDAGQARQAIGLAAKNFPRFSFDLIYARRDQTPDLWEAELREALALTGGHLSAYQLTIEPNTAFHTLAGRGEKLTAPEDQAAVMYEQTQAILREAGMPAYEISNHAKPGEESRHNLAYWTYGDYIGIGPGAHGRYQLSSPPEGEDAKTWLCSSKALVFAGEGVNEKDTPSPAKTRDLLRKSGFSLPPPPGGRSIRIATENHRAPDVWLWHVSEHGHGLRAENPVDDATAKREALLMGLRLTGGISRKAWRDKFGSEMDVFLAPGKIARLAQEGYIADTPDALYATQAGLQRLNAVLDYLAN